MTPLRLGSLFTGYGGLDLAVADLLGTGTVWHSEIDPAACQVLDAHWPEVPNLGDVTIVDFTTVEPIDVLAAGFPCQDLSCAGQMTGLTGQRSGLWAHTLRAVAELRPELVVLENVRGLLHARADRHMEPCPWCVGDGTSSDMRALGALLADLATVGYDARWCCLPASAAGGPHGRERVFAAAYPGHRGIPEWARQARREAGQWTAVRSEPGRAGDQPVPNPASEPGHDRRGDTPGRTPSPQTLGQPGGCDHRPADTDDSGQLPQRDSQPQTGSPAPSLGLHAAGHLLDWGPYAAAVERWEHILGRPAPEPTETGPRGSRRLSPAFVEWMMGLDSGWVTGLGLTRTQALRLLGNGVVPQQAALALSHLFAESFGNGDGIT